MHCDSKKEVITDINVAIYKTKYNPEWYGPALAGNTVSQRRGCFVSKHGYDHQKSMICCYATVIMVLC